MLSICDYKLNNQQFFVYVNATQKYVTYVLLDCHTKDDVYRKTMGEATLDVVLVNSESVERYADSRYIREVLKRNRVSGAIQTLDGRNSRVLMQFLDTFNFAQAYSFRKSDIEVDETSANGSILAHRFRAHDPGNAIALEYYKENRDFLSFEYHQKDAAITARTTTLHLSMPELQLKEYLRNDKEKVIAATLQTITYQDLEAALDMSWYKENGILKKQYQSIKTIDEFETKIITPLAEAVEQCEALGEKLLLAIDTETTGLNVYELSDDNPDKDHCVAIPISWEDDKAYVIFTDMKYFASIDNKYVMQRLAPFITRDRSKINGESDLREIQLYVTSNKNELLSTLDAFGKTAMNAEFEFSAARSIHFHRSTINLTGHNIMFDGRVFYDYGVAPYFDDDTLQMAFDLNPQVVRGANKLKVLTRRLLGCETPELEDILGKGNEDKYRYLRDEQVAEIYGCADADFSRLVFKVLRKLMSDTMYETYRQQDIQMENILYISEYKGMVTEQDKLKIMAQNSKEDLETLTEFMYNYVGQIITLMQQHATLVQKMKAGLISEEQFYNLEHQIKQPKKECRFVFELKAQSIREVLYDILGYPIYAYTDGDAAGHNKKPKTDKFVMKKLISQKRDESFKHVSTAFSLEKDIISKSITRAEYDRLINDGNYKRAAEYCLISAKEFNRLKYPLALALQKYSELNKEYTSYFKPILETNMEGRIFKNYSLARIETRRIMNPGQTMKGSLKALIRPYSDDYYNLDFDMAQVEYRIMASLAGHTEIINKMRNPEKDYHIETAALVWSIPPYEVSKKLRKQTKSIGFGVPYGLTLPSLAERLFGAANDDTLFETAMLLEKWEKSNMPIMNFLEHERDKALKEWVIPDDLRNYMDAWERDYVYDNKGKLISSDYKLTADGKKIPIPIGRAMNEYGFYRTFDLSNLTTRKISKIRRMAGNYPIQSYAAELFRKILLRFYNECVRYGIEDKVVWHMLIHDELLCSVHKSVHPFLIYKIVKKACMCTIKGHTNYFVGINIGNSWAETKDDSREAPVFFVNRMVKRYDAGEFKETWIDNPGEYVMKYRKVYISDRIHEVLAEIQPDIDVSPIDLKSILSKCTNYVVRSYVSDYPQNRKVASLPQDATKEEQAKHADELWVASLESWILERYGEGKLVLGLDDNVYKVMTTKVDAVYKEKVIDLEENTVDDAEEVLDDYWSFDDDGIDYNFHDDAVVEEDNSVKNYTIVENKNAKNIADLIQTRKRYQNLLVTKNQIIISIDRKQKIQYCKNYLKGYVKNSGTSVLFRTPIENIRWLSIDQSVDLHELDNFISGLRG